MTSPDPIHAAAHEYAFAARSLTQVQARHAALVTTLAAAKALPPASVCCDVAGQAVELRSHRAIDRLFRRAREGQANASALAAAEAKVRENLDRERQRVAAVRNSLDAAGVEKAVEDARNSVFGAYLNAIRAVPTTLAGLRVLIDLAANPPAHDWSHVDAARRSLAAAATALLPEEVVL